jgi:ABC-type branched-subunit amino acid transport system substrate-binding protein
VTGETKGGIVDALRRTRSIATRDGDDARPRTRIPWILVPVASIALVASACSSTPAATTSTSTTTTTTSGSSSASTTPPAASPGVTSTTVTVGQVDDLTAPLPGLFKGAEDGTEAYFDYIDSLGGVNGRMIKLDAQDSAYNDGTVANATAAQIQSDFALVGGFSLDDSAEEPLIKAAGMPDIAYPLDPALSELPDSYSPAPNNDDDYPLTVFKILKKKFPTQIKHMGILWANATPSTATAEKAFERAAESQGFKIVYDSGFMTTQTTFLANVLKMKSVGVQMFFTTQMPDSYSATLAEEMQQQNFAPIVVQGDAYSANLVKDGGSAVNNMYLELGYVLYLGADQDLPAAKLFDKWMIKADPSANFELESLYGWASAQLFVQGLRGAGNPPTRAGLEAALDKVTSFDASGLLSNANPAQNIPGSCDILAQVKNGQIVRVPPTPATGFICSPGGYLPAPGFKPEVRPAPSS